MKKQIGIHSFVRHKKAASANKDGAEKYIGEFKKLAEYGGFSPHQIFNCDETSLLWKMPNRTYITEEEKSVPGHKPIQERLRFLLCAIASRELKCQSFLV